MTAPSAIPVYTQGFGTSSTNPTIIAQVAPGNYLPVGIKLGQHWINEAANNVYVLTSVSTSAGVTTPTWTLLESGASSFLSLTGDTGTATPSSGNVKIAGTANQITTAASGSTVTLSIPSSPSLPGTVTAATGFTATTGNFTASAAGAGIVLNSGTASGTTTATLNGRSGQVTITTPTINAGATFSFALTNSSITASTTQVLYGLTGGTTGSAITIQSVTNSASTSTIVIQNASAVTNSTGSLVLTFLVLN